MKLLNKFIGKIFCLTLFLLIIVILDNFKILNMDAISIKLNHNINFIQIAKMVDGKLNVINWGDDVVKVFSDDVKTYEQNGIIYYTSYNSNVYNLELGSVVKILKKNNLYEVTILSKSNILYTYINLKEINVNMYTIVKCNDLIGLSSCINGEYTYGVQIINED